MFLYIIRWRSESLNTRCVYTGFSYITHFLVSIYHPMVGGCRIYMWNSQNVPVLPFTLVNPFSTFIATEMWEYGHICAVVFQILCHISIMMMMMMMMMMMIMTMISMLLLTMIMMMITMITIFVDTTNCCNRYLYLTTDENRQLSLTLKPICLELHWLRLPCRLS